MKVLFAVHGYPPELVGGTENTVQALARGVARAGGEAVVVAGSLDWESGYRVSESTDTDPVSGRPVAVYRIHRDDLYFDHWHKSVSARVARDFRAILERERPDVVHVHHWLRLTRDLVAVAARVGIPAAVTLHDLWTTCPITFRVRSDTGAFCESPMAADPCLGCSGRVPPRTPWVDVGQSHMLLAERRADVVRELSLARVVAVPSRAHARSVAEFLGLDPDALRLRVVPPGRDLELPRLAPREAPSADRPLVLTTWGHHSSLKGTDLLVEAIGRLPDPGRVELHVLGECVTPAYEAELRRLADGLPVRFHGAFAGTPALADHPGVDAHLMVSGTRARESWGMVVDEALRLGLPCVLPRAGAFVERVQGAQGAGGDGAWALLFDPGDPASLAAALQSVLDDPDRLVRLRAALPEPAAIVPTLAEHVAGWTALYEEVVPLGGPEVEEPDWWQDRMRAAFEADWDASLRQRSASEVGFE